jgi:hypothetical protein
MSMIIEYKWDWGIRKSITRQRREHVSGTLSLIMGEYPMKMFYSGYAPFHLFLQTCNNQRIFHRI